MNRRKKYEDKKMGYALFAQRKLVLNSQLNSAQLQQTQRSDEQYQLATQRLSKGQQLSSLQASQANQLAELYSQLADIANDSEYDDDPEQYQKARDGINDQINSLEQTFQQEIDAINRDIYTVSVKENAIENEVKRLDTMVTVLQQQLDAVQEAEGQAIERAIPKYAGLQ